MTTFVLFFPSSSPDNDDPSEGSADAPQDYLNCYFVKRRRNKFHYQQGTLSLAAAGDLPNNKMDLESQPLGKVKSPLSSLAADGDEDEEDGREEVYLHGSNVTWKSVSSVTGGEKRPKEPLKPLTSTAAVNRSHKVSPFLGGFVNPLANATTPLKKNISPSNYHSGYDSDSSSTASSNSLHESLFPKTASWRIMSISGRRPSNVKILSMDDSGSWRVLSQKGSKKSQPSFPMVVRMLPPDFFFFFSFSSF